MTIVLRQSFTFFPQRVPSDDDAADSPFGEATHPILTPIFATRKLLNATAPHLISEDRPVDSAQQNLGLILIRFAPSCRYVREIAFEQSASPKVILRALRTCPYIQHFNLFNLSMFGIAAPLPAREQDLSDNEEEDGEEKSEGIIIDENTHFSQLKHLHDIRSLVFVSFVFGGELEENFFDKGFCLSRAKLDTVNISYPHDCKPLQFLPKLFPKCRNTLKKFIYSLGAATGDDTAPDEIFADDAIICLCENAPMLEELVLGDETFHAVTRNDTLQALSSTTLLKKLEILTLLSGHFPKDRVTPRKSLSGLEEPALDISLLHLPRLEELIVSNPASFHQWECLPHDCFPNLKHLQLRRLERKFDHRSFILDCLRKFGKLETLSVLCRTASVIGDEESVKAFSEMESIKSLKFNDFVPSKELLGTFLVNLPPNIEELKIIEQLTAETERREEVIAVLEANRDEIKAKGIGKLLTKFDVIGEDTCIYAPQKSVDQLNEELISNRRLCLRYLEIVGELFPCIESVFLVESSLFGAGTEYVKKNTKERNAIVQEQLAPVLAKFKNLKEIIMNGKFEKGYNETRTTVEFWDAIAY